MERALDYLKTHRGASLQQVADAVTSQGATRKRLTDARDALAASQDAYDIAEARYRGGLSNYLDVLTVQDRLLQARLAVAGLNGDLRSVDIALIRALGGGFEPIGPNSKDQPHG